MPSSVAALRCICLCECIEVGVRGNSNNLTATAKATIKYFGVALVAGDVAGARVDERDENALWHVVMKLPCGTSPAGAVVAPAGAVVAPVDAREVVARS
jgi:hypothetical protein